MKYSIRTIAFVLATLVVYTSCKKLTSLADINFSIPIEQSANVDGLPNSPYIPPNDGLKASIPAIPVPTNIEQYSSDNNTNTDLIRHIYIGSLSLEVNEPQSQTLDLVDSLWVHLAAAGLPELLVAHKYDIQKGIRSIDLNTAEDDIRNYFLADTVYFRVEGHFNKAPDSASKFTIKGKFDAVANPLEKDE